MATKQNSVVEHSTTGISGYDAVAYFTEGKPRRGNGRYAAQFDGVTYLFASEDNKKKFEADPEAWKIVDGKLYLNLDKDVQAEWGKDVPGNIRKADSIWLRIKDTPPSDL